MLSFQVYTESNITASITNVKISLNINVYEINIKNYIRLIL